MDIDDDPNIGLEVVAELRRRKVLRSTTLYAIVGWCFLQWSDLLFAHMGWPDWTLRWPLTFVVLGFPVVVTLSWIFDITPDGVRRSLPDQPPPKVPPLIGHLVTALMVLLLAVTVFSLAPL